MSQATSATAQQKAKRYALKFNPPCIFLEYEDVDGHCRVRAVKLVSVTADTDVERLTRKVIRSFPRRLDATSVKYDQVRKLVFKLVEHVRATSQQQQQQLSAPAAQAAAPAGRLQLPAAASPGGCGGELPNTPSTPYACPTLSPKLPEPWGPRAAGRLAAAGAVHMSTDSRFSTSTTSLAHALVADQQGGGVHLLGSQQEERDDQDLEGLEDQGPGLSGLDDMLDHLQHELGPAPVAAHGCGQLDSSWQQSSGTCASSGRAAPMQQRAAGGSSLAEYAPESRTQPQATASEEEEEEEEGALVLEPDLQADLNHATELELQLAKQRMERDFLRNQLKPGDEGYQYDVQVEFEAPTEACGWDDDDSRDG